MEVDKHKCVGSQTWVIKFNTLYVYLGADRCCKGVNMYVVYIKVR